MVSGGLCIDLRYLPLSRAAICRKASPGDDEKAISLGMSALTKPSVSY